MAGILRKILFPLGLCSIFFAFANGEVIPVEEEFLSVNPEEEYKLKPDEVWPEEIAHLFGSVEDGKTQNEETPAKEGRRSRRWTEWVSEKHEYRDDSWDEPSQRVLDKPKDTPKFIAYYKNGTYIMSRCSSPSGAVTLVIACPQPRGSQFHRIVNLKHAVYGWTQHGGPVCQYVEGDCTNRYEFVHKQIMKPTTPQNHGEWQALGPQYFCNPWPGNGREPWEFPEKRWCSVGLKRSSPTPKQDDALKPGQWGRKYLYTWPTCGSPYDWFDYLHIEYTCVDIMEPIDAEATRPYHYRPKPDCAKVAKTTPEPAGASDNGTTTEGK